MRRAFSILLALLFGLGPLAAALPACCRRMGAHHCALASHGTTQGAASNGRPAMSAPDTCPYYPRAVMALIAPIHALVAIAPDLPVPASSARTLSLAKIPAQSVPSRTHAGRGPPAPI